MVDTAPTHPQPEQESQLNQTRYVNILVNIFYPLDKSKVVVRTTNDQNETIDTTTDAYIVAKKLVNNVSDDVVETLYDKAFVQDIQMKGVVLVNEGDSGIEEDVGSNPVMVYTVEVQTHSILTIGG